MSAAEDILKDTFPVDTDPTIEHVETIIQTLENLELTDLRQVVEGANELLAKREIEELERARQQVKDLAKKLNVDAEYLLAPQAKPKATRKPKESAKPVTGYRNPDNPNQVWSGKGRKPHWFTDAIGAGTPEESMRI